MTKRKRRGRNALRAGAVAIAVGLALSSVVAHAATSSLMPKPDVRKRLLTLSEIQVASGEPVAADSVECHHNPYVAGTYANYCFYVLLHSDAAYAGSRAWPNHVDVIALASSSLARDYVQGMKKSRTTSTLLSSTPTMTVFYDKNGFITLPGDSSSASRTVQGPSVTVFAPLGAQAVYVACADPKAVSPVLLQKCAIALARAQMRKLG